LEPRLKDNLAINDLFSTVSDILKGMTRDVPARMAIEHVTAVVSRLEKVRWCAFALLVSDDQVQCISAIGRDACPPSKVVENLVSPWSQENITLDRSLYCTQISSRGEDAGADHVTAAELVDSAGQRCGWLVCLADCRMTEELQQLLRMLSWLISAALEHDRLHSRMSTLDQRHISVIESQPHVIYEQSLDDDFIYLSRKIQNMTGYKSEDLVGGDPTYQSIIHPEDRAKRQSILDQLKPSTDATVSYDFFLKIPSEKACHVEYRLMHKNGRDIVWVADHFLLRIKDPNETISNRIKSEDFIVVGALVDLRERKVLEMESLQQSKLATIGELAAGVAHEVNNPLTAVLTYGQLLERWFQKQAIPETAQKKGSEYLRHILEQGKNIYEITRNLTGFVRKEAGESFQPVNVNELITTSLSIFRYPFKKERISLNIDASFDLPPIRARIGKLRQVLLNLVGNARASLNTKYPLGSGLNPDKAIHISGNVLQKQPHFVRITVTDFGEGIASENLERIFDTFYTTRKEGTGLGLSISASILKEHNGRLTAESTRNRKTSFFLDIPIWASKSKSSRLRSNPS
jgi:two-component system, NtrC family, sensor kinase